VSIAILIGKVFRFSKFFTLKPISEVATFQTLFSSVSAIRKRQLPACNKKCHRWHFRDTFIEVGWPSIIKHCVFNKPDNFKLYSTNNREFVDRKVILD
jgi:hypothetical protein